MAKIVIDTEELYELEEAADHLKIGIATLFRWMKKGDIVPFRWLGRTFIPKTEVDRLNKNKEAAGG